MKVIISALLVLMAAGSLAAADNYFDQLQPDQKIHGFTATNVYENGSGDAMGARFISDAHGFIIDLMQIESVPQAFYWIKTMPTSSKGEPHACEHLLLGKGNRGRYVAVLEDMSLGNSTAYTGQLRTCYHFNTTASMDAFYDIFEAKLQAFLHPDFADEEIRREVCHLGVVEDPESGELSIDEKGTVYTEMVSSFEKPWYHTWGALNKMVYGEQHPLAYNSGGDPDVMRDMTADDMWKFHAKTHHLANMGAIVSIPRSMEVPAFLAKMQEILVACNDAEFKSDLVGIGAYDLPPSAGAPVGTSAMVTYPSERAEDQGYMLYAWPNSLELEPFERFMLDLYLETFAGGPTSNLYDLFINSETRRLDIGGNYVYAGTDSDLGVSIFLGLVGVRHNEVTQKMVDSVAGMVTSEFARVHDFAPGSAELDEFNQKALGRLVQNRKEYDKYLNSPPMFGFRSGAGSGWVSLLEELEEEEGFRKSLVMADRFARAESLLTTGGNFWTDYIDRWQVLTVPPYQVGAFADPGMLTDGAAAKEKRMESYVNGFKERYRTSDAQLAVAKYRQEFDANTAELEAARSKQELPDFIDNPPMAIDGQLDYATIAVGPDVPMVASTFQNMTASTLALALRLDVVPEDQLLYVPILPDVLTGIGVIKDGQVVTYDDMRQRLRTEILGLGAGFDQGLETERVELVLTGEAANQQELTTAIDWMDAALFSPYLSLDNLPRIQDVIDQSLADCRNRTKGSEESWVNIPAQGYRFQTNPLIMSTSCFLTQVHHWQRLKWRLTDPGNDQESRELVDLLEILGEFGQQKTRAELLDILGRLESVDQELDDSLLAALPPPARTLSDVSKKNVAKIAKELKASLADIPEGNLAADWAYLCRETKEDMLVSPETALADLESILDLIRHTDLARSYFVSNAADRESVTARIAALTDKLNPTPSVVAQYSPIQRVVQRLNDRESSVTDPTYVGLIHDGTRNGVLLFSAPHADGYDTTEAAVIDCLAGKLFGGGGPHGLFMQTWAAGLAYSNGYSYSPSTGRVSYYAERCPDVAETMAYVVNILKHAEEDPSLVDYAIAQVFAASRAQSRHEDRGRAMASDLADGYTPEKVAAFRHKVLSLKDQYPDLYDRLKARMEAAYGPVLIGYGQPLAESEGGTFFLIGPEDQFTSLEDYIEGAEGPQTIHRLYPRDFWLRMN
ncbi:MAG: hypothetical protein ABIE70_02490 [bacterium]